MLDIMTVDVEDWFNILDTPYAPPIEQWQHQQIRFEKPMYQLLDMFAEHKVQATFFWLGWFAERYPGLVRECMQRGHEIASHGYGHVLAYKVGPAKFREDIRKSKAVLEDITGTSISGFRAAGFSTLNNTLWTFDEIAEAGFRYDSSVFPAKRGHGGMASAILEPYCMSVKNHVLWEFPQSMLQWGKFRLSLFGGGYLRLFPYSLINYGIKNIHEQKRPLIVYIHPREIDPEHPRLPLSYIRKIKSYINLNSTLYKLTKLCYDHLFVSMQTYLEGKEKESCKNCDGILCSLSMPYCPYHNHQKD